MVSYYYQAAVNGGKIQKMPPAKLPGMTPPVEGVQGGKTQLWMHGLPHYFSHTKQKWVIR